MQDRQQFEHKKLQNGITAFTFQHPFPISCFELIMPVGAGHCFPEGRLLPGAAHFLEHIQLIRCHDYPEPYQLDHLLGLRGGHSNGTTYPTTTHYEIDVPASETNFASEAFVNRIFSPILNADDLETERSVIINERNQRKFYPGRNPVTQHYNTEFLIDGFYPVEQIFGSDQNLQDMTVDLMRTIHQEISHCPGIVALAVGPDDFSQFHTLLESLPTSTTDFPLNITPTTWGTAKGGKAFFETISQPTLEVAWLHPRIPYEEFRAVSFIISLLINTTHGSLYQEFREAKGWTYGLDGYAVHRQYNSLIGLSFPVNKVEQVEYILDCLLDRIQAAVTNQELVEHEISRQLCNQVYSYQTASDIISGASYDILTYGQIYNEASWVQSVEKMRDATWRQQVFARYFTQEAMGTICYMPERRKSVFVRNAPTVVTTPQPATLKTT